MANSDIVKTEPLTNQIQQGCHDHVRMTILELMNCFPPPLRLLLWML